jgi:NAD(P)-dependent dehydrogenase (short-subunit alcohol dehydrogenase family)
VHVAAVIRRRELYEVTEDDWDAQLNVNLKAVFFLNLAVARHLRTTRGGSITNFVSQAWWSGGLAGSVVYAASKAGVVAMSRGLARELASNEIRVNTVAPGIVDTPMMHLELTDEQRKWATESVPLGRMAEPEEVAGLTVFLASDQARYITGASISVSGGQFMY